MNAVVASFASGGACIYGVRGVVFFKQILSLLIPKLGEPSTPRRYRLKRYIVLSFELSWMLTVT